MPTNPPFTSTVERGDLFREQVLRMLVAAGFSHAASEIRDDFKKTDISATWTRTTMEGLRRYRFEAKDYAGTVDKQQCINFVTEYGTLVDADAIDAAWLVSRGPISPDGRALIEANRRKGLRCLTFTELQRQLLQLDGYLDDLVRQYNAKDISQFYIRPHTRALEEDLETLIREWIEGTDSTPRAIIGSYGQGKSTFALHLAASLARDALSDPTKRVPILVRLGEIVDDQSLDGLLGKVLASQHRAGNYHFDLFKELNTAGRFVIIYDALDEMKHGMVLSSFERNVNKLLELDGPNARVLLLGRDTAFHNDVEFRSIILGRQQTRAGREIDTRGRRALIPLDIRGFTLEEARHFVSRYFPLRAREAVKIKNLIPDDAWINQRTEELIDGSFDHLIVRPVHAQMLCDIATDPAEPLIGGELFNLYDTFVHFLIDREIAKAGRDPSFGNHVRRGFNAAFAWWLWERSQAATTTFADTPIELCYEAIGDIAHDYDDEGLKRELTAGCLVEKDGGTVYFGHRSILEFLVAEHLYETNLLGGSAPQLGRIWPLMNSVIAGFMTERLALDDNRASVARDWLQGLKTWGARDLNFDGAELFFNLTAFAKLEAGEIREFPWYLILNYFRINGSPTFAPTSEKVIGEARAILKGSVSGRAKHQAAAILIWLWVIDSALDEDVQRLSAELLAHCLPIGEVIPLLERLRKDTARHNIQQDVHLTFWAFFAFTKFRRLPARDLVLEFDLKRLHAAVEEILGFSFAHLSEWRNPTISISALYSALAEKGIKQSQMDTIRSLISDDKTRDRVNPLIVKKVSLNTRTKAQ